MTEEQNILLSRFEGVWYTKEKNEKLIIKNDNLEVYYVYEGGEEKAWEGKIELQGISISPIEENYNLPCPYYRFEPSGKLLLGYIMVLDAPVHGIEFAKEEDEDAFTRYPKSLAEVKDKHLDTISLSLNYLNFNEVLKNDYKNWHKATSISFSISKYRKTTCRLYVNNNSGDVFEDKNFEVDQEFLDKVLEIIDKYKILENNPKDDSSDMMMSHNSAILSGKFLSNEVISITSRYGFPYTEDFVKEIIDLALLNKN